MNLKDRMNSDSQQTNTQDTTPKSNPLSPALVMQKQSDTIRQQSVEIQTLSSENSELRKELQKKSEIIISLNEQLGTLSSADLILKENERLEQNNLELQQKLKKVKKEASDSISAIKMEYRNKQAKLQKNINDAFAKKKAAEELIEEENSRIDDLAERKITNIKEQMVEAHEKMESQNNTRYRCKVSALYIVTVFGVLYSVLLTMLTAVKSQRFLGDIISAASFIAGFITDLWKNAYSLASAAWSLHESIPYDVINVIIPGVLAGLGFVAVFGGILGGIGFLIYKIVRFYVDHFTDSISLLIVLIPLALLVCLADYLTFISWNLLLIYLIILASYTIIRMLVSKRSENHLFS